MKSEEWEAICAVEGLHLTDEQRARVAQGREAILAHYTKRVDVVEVCCDADDDGESKSWSLVMDGRRCAQFIPSEKWAKLMRDVLNANLALGDEKFNEWWHGKKEVK